MTADCGKNTVGCFTGTLVMAFLTHFQLPIRYETDMKLLTSLRQYKSNHIYDHIHEW